MQYSKKSQAGKKKLTRTQINQKANKKLAQMQIDKDIRHCELCSTTAVSNAHRFSRVWFHDKPDYYLWDYSNILFLCIKCHTKIDDRSKIKEEEKEQIFIKLRGK